MRRLLLLRHAKAAPLAGGGDHARPLALRGRQDAARLGAWLQERRLTPDLAIVSDARRARETAEIVFAGLAEKVSRRLEPRVYNATPQTLLAFARAAPATAQAVMMIGHNPGFAELAQSLTGYGDRYAAARLNAKFPTCGLAILDFDVETWAGLKPRAGRLDSFITPALLGGEDD